jgi:hypothetical protein
VAQAIEHLPNKCKARVQDPLPPKRKEKQELKNGLHQIKSFCKANETIARI